jgi:hypothetical protein
LEWTAGSQWHEGGDDRGAIKVVMTGSATDLVAVQEDPMSAEAT